MFFVLWRFLNVIIEKFVFFKESKVDSLDCFDLVSNLVRVMIFLKIYLIVMYSGVLESVKLLWRVRVYE